MKAWLKTACILGFAAMFLAATSHLSSLKTPTIHLADDVSMELVFIPAGDFMMGSGKSPEEVAHWGHSNPSQYVSEHPQHRVCIARPFLMGRCEVTQSQWQAVMGDNPSSFTGDANLPVDNVSWEECQSFCERLSQRIGREVRLPTEAEWEYACRAGTTTVFSCGDRMDDLGDHGWNDFNSDARTHRVGRKGSNAMGLCDMHGNLWEWCEDVWHDNYVGAPPDGSAWTAGANANDRVLRGGGWDAAPWRCRSAFRNKHAQDYKNHNIGFRIVVAAE